MLEFKFEYYNFILYKLAIEEPLYKIINNESLIYGKHALKTMPWYSNKVN